MTMKELIVRHVSLISTVVAQLVDLLRVTLDEIFLTQRKGVIRRAQ